MSTSWNEQSEPQQDLPERADPELEASVEGQPVEPAAVITELIACWRCGLMTELVVRCVHCRAELQSSGTAAARGVSAGEETSKLFRLILVYSLMLMVSIAWAIYSHSSRAMSRQESRIGLVVVECIDILLTVSLIFLVGRSRLGKPPEWVRCLTWSLAPVVSVCMYLLTHWYVEMLRRYVQLDWLYAQPTISFTLFTVLVVAVQPAIFEELFFRYFAYGTLRRVTTIPSAVVLTALMFALAHLYNPLGLPFLFFMGLMLGYARVGSGGLLLPMLMHFGHNLAVIYFESHR